MSIRFANRAHAFEGTSLLLGRALLGGIYQVRPRTARRELGNMLVVAPTRGGKGLLAVSQLLTWRHSAIVNDIKGELFLQTAGYRSTLGPVFCLDPEGRGHHFDPLHTKQSEKDLLSVPFINRHWLRFETVMPLWRAPGARPGRRRTGPRPPA